MNIELLREYFTNNPTTGVTINLQQDGSYIVSFSDEFDIESVMDEEVKEEVKKVVQPMSQH